MKDARPSRSWRLSTLPVRLVVRSLRKHRPGHRTQAGLFVSGLLTLLVGLWFSQHLMLSLGITTAALLPLSLLGVVMSVVWNRQRRARARVSCTEREPTEIF